MGAIGGGIVSAIVGNKEGKRQEGAANAANQAQANMFEFQKDIYQDRRDDTALQREVGDKMLRKLYKNSGKDSIFNRDFTMKDFNADPGYQFRMEEGQKALERSAAARGGLNSTRAMRDLSRFSQGLASQEYQNAYNRFTSEQDRHFGKISQLAGMGNSAQAQVGQAAAQLGGAAQNFGNAWGQNHMAGQAARSAANMAGVQAINDGFAQNREMAMQGAGMVTSFCDQRVKENIESISKEDMAELRKAIKPYMFNYANDIYGEGDWVGPMAQDLEKTKLGAWLVDTDREGIRQIDMRKVGTLILASMGEE